MKDNKPLIYSYSIIIISFLFTRLPFFIWAPIIGFYADEFDYFHIVQQMNNGILPKFDFLPLAYPVFLYLIGKFSDKIITIVIIQHAIILFTSLFLIGIIGKYYKKVVIPAAIALSIFLMDSYTFVYDTTLMTESFYISSLILFCALYIMAVNSSNKIVWLLLSINFVLPALIRPNGLYIYFFIFYLLIYLFLNNYNKKYYFCLLTPFLILNLLWAGYNYFTLDQFGIGNVNRIKYVTGSSNVIAADSTTTSSLSKTNLYQQPWHVKIKSTFFQYLNSIAVTKSPFYYIMLPERYRVLYVWDIRKDPDFKMMDRKVVIPEDLKQLVFKEYYEPQDPYGGNMKNFDMGHKTNNWWVLLQHIYYRISDYLFRNFIWTLAFISVLISSSYILIKSKFQNKEAFIISSFCLIHFLSIIILSYVHPIFRLRYTSVSEFTLYLSIVLYLLLLKVNFFKRKPNAQQ